MLHVLVTAQSPHTCMWKILCDVRSHVQIFIVLMFFFYYFQIFITSALSPIFKCHSLLSLGWTITRSVMLEYITFYSSHYWTLYTPFSEATQFACCYRGRLSVIWLEGTQTFSTTRWKTRSTEDWTSTTWNSTPLSRKHRLLVTSAQQGLYCFQ